ncbi:glycine cleavage system protein GcvH [Microbacterium sp. NM3R9]|uniref:glycine cleavage system protein GcvH n=1 Tax=Microbacterium thalli TaxID=3027921 RepID=UPI0023663543|nr:glycine cleavage system protein GcvH [Microbacterium thalli]MDN8548550.1 glycine cleavage system protein GcvH [Microbacterium thalli]
MTDLDALKYTAEHEWVSLSGTTATVGITDYAAEKLGDVVYVDLPAVGTAVTADQVCGEIESTKSVGELYAPLSGEVVEINDAVVDDPSQVNAAPFDTGWLIRITVDPAQVAGLLDRAAYLALTGGDR